MKPNKTLLGKLKIARVVQTKRESKQETQRRNTKKEIETEGIVWQAQPIAFGDRDFGTISEASRTASRSLQIYFWQFWSLLFFNVFHETRSSPFYFSLIPVEANKYRSTVWTHEKQNNTRKYVWQFFHGNFYA